MTPSTWAFVTDTNFIANGQTEVGILLMLGAHSRFSHLPLVNVRSWKFKKYGMYSVSCVDAASDAR